MASEQDPNAQTPLPEHVEEVADKAEKEKGGLSKSDEATWTPPPEGDNK